MFASLGRGFERGKTRRRTGQVSSLLDLADDTGDSGDRIRIKYIYKLCIPAQVSGRLKQKTDMVKSVPNLYRVAPTRNRR